MSHDELLVLSLVAAFAALVTAHMALVLGLAARRPLVARARRPPGRAARPVLGRPRGHAQANGGLGRLCARLSRTANLGPVTHPESL